MEKHYFKYSHKRYFAEFTPTLNRPAQWILWAIDVRTGKEHFLGAINNGQLIKNESLIGKDWTKKFDWDVQQGAKRLYCIVRSEYNGDMRTSAPNELRNRGLVTKRIKDPTLWSWGKLAKIYNISRPTALEVFETHLLKYASREEIENYNSLVGAKTVSYVYKKLSTT